LMLNAPWSVGYVSSLIELKAFSEKEEWEDFYYEMGAYRLKKMSALPTDIQQLLNNELLIRQDRQQIKRLSKTIKNINTQNGRTKAELEKKGTILFRYIQQRHPHISEKECQQAVRFRVIGETWNGIVLRERNTIKTLESHFPNLKFIKKSGDFDHKYAVDYEVYQHDQLICALQIKPKSYTYSTPYINKARSANQRKNTLYQQEFSAPVFDIISTSKGILQDLKPIEAIKLLEKNE